MSSAAVRQASNGPDFFSARASRDAAEVPALKATTVASPGCSRWAKRQFLQQRSVAQRDRRLGLVDDVAQFAGAQQRHRRHHDQPGLGHGQPGQRHADRIAAAQQHPVAGYQDRDPRPARCRFGRLAVAPANRSMWPSWTAAAGSHPSLWLPPCPAAPRPDCTVSGTAIPGGHSEIAATAPAAQGVHGRIGRSGRTFMASCATAHSCRILGSGPGVVLDLAEQLVQERRCPCPTGSRRPRRSIARAGAPSR